MAAILDKKSNTRRQEITIPNDEITVEKIVLIIVMIMMLVAVIFLIIFCIFKDRHKGIGRCFRKDQRLGLFQVGRLFRSVATEDMENSVARLKL
jgi:flagellar basal body-associated protein FliL